MIRCAVVDIGSTWTKGGMFEVDEIRQDTQPELSAFYRVPTTLDDLGRGFFQVLRELNQGKEFGGPVYASSSAKGGLRVAALGLVPDLTLKMARQTALSAGARITKIYSYELTPQDLLEIDKDPPDILLFAGGTDGGNKAILQHNTLQLRTLKTRPSVLFAGNRAMASFVADALEDFPLTLTENLLPELDRPNPGPARAALRVIFMERIIQGKGLAGVQARCAEPIIPTPMRVFDFVRALADQNLEGWQYFCLGDLGGATTDLYSVGGEGPSEAGVVLAKGIADQPISRTVEGDLGMRHSAGGVLESRRGWLESHLYLHLDQHRSPKAWKTLEDYAQKVELDYTSIAQTSEEVAFDSLIAGAALSGALERHAGRIEQIYTPQGVVAVQRGKDLRNHEKLILTGGVFTASRRQDKIALTTSAIDDEGKLILLPKTWKTYTDDRTLVPLYANLAAAYPGPAVRGLVAFLQKEQL